MRLTVLRCDEIWIAEWEGLLMPCRFFLMADDRFKETSSSAGAEPRPKDEPVRITLPPKPGDLPREKRETVGIDVSGKTSEGAEPETAVRPHVPESEISKGVAPRVKPPVAGAKPPVPPPVPKAPFPGSPSVPRPPKPPVASGPAPRPPVVPKPPTLGSKAAQSPVTPYKPAIPPSGEIRAENELGAVQKTLASKRATRIEVPPGSREDSRTPSRTEQPKPKGSTPPAVTEPIPKRRDFAMTWLAIAALVAAALSLFFSYLAFNSV